MRLKETIFKLLIFFIVIITICVIGYFALSKGLPWIITLWADYALN